VKSTATWYSVNFVSFKQAYSNRCLQKFGDQTHPYQSKYMFRYNFSIDCLTITIAGTIKYVYQDNQALKMATDRHTAQHSLKIKQKFILYFYILSSFTAFLLSPLFLSSSFDNHNLLLSFLLPSSPLRQDNLRKFRTKCAITEEAIKTVNDTDRGRPECLEKTLSHCHLVQQKSHIGQPRIEPGSPR